MNGKAIILTTLLAVGAQSVWGYSRGSGGSSSSPSPPSQGQSPSRLTTMAQRSLLRHCFYTAELAGKHTDELLKSATHGRPNPDQIRQHLREVRGAVDSMFEDHKRFLYSLSEEQWGSAKEPITALEQIRASVQVQIEGIELELQMPTPDSKVFARYGKQMKALLQDWRQQHRKMGAAIGVKL